MEFYYRVTEMYQKVGGGWMNFEEYNRENLSF